ncbi:MAG: hypothetical protein PHQ40_21075 [Anaerolineaceae bacterium]|nr:hypothetical protein [Anaerolineaceae bacterium]
MDRTTRLIWRDYYDFLAYLFFGPPAQDGAWSRIPSMTPYLSRE